MAATKDVSVLHNDATMTGGAGPTNSSAANLATGYGASVLMKITNGATAPTTAASIILEVSADSINWYEMNGGSVDLQGTTTNNDVVSKHFEIPPGVKYVRSATTHGDDQDVTVRVEVGNVSAVA